MTRRSPAPAPALPKPGFTVLDLVIALALVAVLLALAVPGYQRYQQRAERADAVRQLLAAAACQERLRAATGYFDTTRCLEGASSRSYRFRIEPEGQATDLAFKVIADPADSARQDACGWLSLDQAGSRAIGGNGRVDTCWGGR